MSGVAVTIDRIGKSFGSLQAVEDVSLSIARGTIFGLLGPNGAGKTTLIRILTTQLRPTKGLATVEGYDVASQGKKVRGMIGVVPQENNLDRYLTARENLVLHARLHDMQQAEYNPRIDELLELTGLANRQHDFPDTFSGGMQRRLVVARALVHAPQLLFLDEPTTGLDPQSRRAVWGYIQQLKETMTIFLTTHYLEEADALCDRIVIIDHGKVLADGTAAELKERMAQASGYELQFHSGIAQYEELLAGLPFVSSVHREGEKLQLCMQGGDFLKSLLEAVTTTDIKSITLREPSLEDVFIHLTGKEVRD
jgi:ABC-2 type transport system ATP-binding protein